MGLDYSLKLTTRMSRYEALALLAENIPGPKRSDDKVSLHGSDIIIAVVEPDQLAQASVQDVFGFSP